jgi:hypothetical protein
MFKELKWDLICLLTRKLLVYANLLLESINIVKETWTVLYDRKVV